MSSYSRWSDIRGEHVRRAGGERAVETGKQELLTTLAADGLDRERTPAAAQAPPAERGGRR